MLFCLVVGCFVWWWASSLCCFVWWWAVLFGGGLAAYMLSSNSKAKPDHCHPTYELMQRYCKKIAQSDHCFPTCERMQQKGQKRKEMNWLERYV